MHEAISAPRFICVGFPAKLIIVNEIYRQGVVRLFRSIAINNNKKSHGKVRKVLRKTYKKIGGKKL